MIYLPLPLYNKQENRNNIEFSTVDSNWFS